MDKKVINKHVFVWVLNFLVGHFGVDRFVRGTNWDVFLQASVQLDDFRNLGVGRFYHFSN